MATIKAGSPVPDFNSTATGEKNITLSELRGKFVVLYFYPKDHTPGCTQEGRDFRDNIAEFEALNAIIFGISRDSLKTHENFKEKQCFPFDLLSDPDEVLCNLFDVIKMKNMYGRKVMGIERSTFLIDANGNLSCEWRKIKVKGHVNAVLEKLREIQTP